MAGGSQASGRKRNIALSFTLTTTCGFSESSSEMPKKWRSNWEESSSEGSGRVGKSSGKFPSFLDLEPMERSSHGIQKPTSNRWCRQAPRNQT